MRGAAVLWTGPMLGSMPLFAGNETLLYAVGFVLLVWLLAEWTARRDADQIAAADGLSREQGGVIAGLIALWIIFRGDDDD